ncbi:MAG: M13 family metallopeptidase [Bacteroidetes bacterium]|nr:M13 family metallopeptidase [Bacteroidota bacterium]MBS1940961.1 M13 family metallopeptidase [Bacteroidota bacterium]
MRIHPFLAPLLFLAACSHPENPKTATALPLPDLLASHVDSTVNPGDNFFLFANGAWLKANPIPASESGWGIGNLVVEELRTKIRTINEEAAKAHAPVGSDQQKIGDYWTTGMDSAKADRLGTAPLNELLRQIDGITNAQQAFAVAGVLNRAGADVLYGGGVEQDPKISTVMAVNLGQGGLGLPDRDYYFNTEAGVAKNRAAYPGHIAHMLMFLGQDSATASKAGAAVFAFETELARNSRTLDQLRDPWANYNKMAVDGKLKATTPHLDWRTLLDSYGLAQCDTVIVGQPEFLVAVDALLHRTPAATVKDYYRFHLLSAFAHTLSGPINRESFSFYGTRLNGQQQQRPRWKRVLDSEGRDIGMVVGKVFVKDYFPQRSKQRYTNLVEAVRSTYRDRINKLDWMSAATKEKALAKLNAITAKVGYPDQWKDYGTLRADTASYAANVLAANRWHFDDQVAKWGKPVDRTEWDMTPQTYNAYYNPSNNEIVLPAGIFLLPGLPDSLADDALVYGYAAASTIGHEITHGFDDEGRQYDASGNLVSWWTPEDSARFTQRAEVMAKQFDAYEPIPGIHINGHATLGENIADFGGIELGLDAFRKTDQYKQGAKIAGYTPLQRYFLGYALGWLHQQKEESLRSRLLSDVHSPAQWRVNGPFANVPEFYEAFHIKEGQPMWRADSVRVKIW